MRKTETSLWPIWGDMADDPAIVGYQRPGSGEHLCHHGPATHLDGSLDLHATDPRWIGRVGVDSLQDAYLALLRRLADLCEDHGSYGAASSGGDQ